MNEIMSNALLSLACNLRAGGQLLANLLQDTATAPASAPAEHLPQALIIALPLGIAAFIIWGIRAVIRPEVLSLAKTPGRPNTLSGFHIGLVLLLWLLAQVLGLMLVRMAMGLPALPPKEPPDPSMATVLLKVNVLNALISSAVMAAVGLLVAKWTFAHGLARGLGLSGRHWLYDCLRALLAWLMIFPLCLGVLHLTDMLFKAINHADWVQEHVLLSAMKSLDDPWRVMIFLVAGVTGPIAEEIFLRGLVQSLLRRVFGKPWLAIGAASAFFAMMHISNPNSIPALFVLAIVLGYLYERTGRLVAPILLHIVFNCINLLLVM